MACHEKAMRARFIAASVCESHMSSRVPFLFYGDSHAFTSMLEQVVSNSGKPTHVHFGALRLDVLAAPTQASRWLPSTLQPGPDIASQF